MLFKQKTFGGIGCESDGQQVLSGKNLLSKNITLELAHKAKVTRALKAPILILVSLINFY